jgi:hypothetical protein
MAGPPSNPPHPLLSLRIPLPRPPRMSSKGHSVHPSLDCGVHSRLWSAGANAMLSTTEIAGSGFLSPIQHLRQAFTLPARELLSKRESPRSPHVSARPNGSPGWIHLDGVTQTLGSLGQESRQPSRTSRCPRKRHRAHLRIVRCSTGETGTKESFLLCRCHKILVITVRPSIPE